ncbi:MAG: VacJ family lipoprotein [Pseudoxanthomonas sp.]
MKPYRLVLVALFAALASACASAPKPAAPASAAEATIVAPAAPADEAVAPVQQDAPAADAASAVAGEGDAPEAAAPTDAEDDFAAIYGGADDAASGPARPPASSDPWEKYNRKVHGFNNAFDKAIARPVARGYAKVVPKPVRTGVGNFFDNLGSPMDMVNLFLQGRPKEAWDTLGRFLMNTTLGIGGLFDPATKAKIARHDADFGQTLAVWGWRRSRYFELPFFGPRTVRDTFGLAGDVPLAPTHYVDDDTIRYSLQALQLVNMRAQLLSLDDIRAGAADDYALVRDAWLQRRNYLIHSRLRNKQQDASLPEYLEEPLYDGRGDVPANAMPIPLP